MHWVMYMCLPKCVCIREVRQPNLACVCGCVCVQVVKSLQEMYDRHKGSYGWQDRPLSIE